MYCCDGCRARFYLGAAAVGGSDSVACGGVPERRSLVRSEHEEILKKNVLEASGFVAVCILVSVLGVCV